MSSEKKCAFCGLVIDGAARYCTGCGQPVSDRVACPHCGSMVPSGKFCGRCGETLAPAAAPDLSVGWDRDNEVFAVKVPEARVKDAESGFEVRHGTKALFFEKGRLVDIADSRRYTRGDSFLSNLFAKKRRLSAVLVDGGDVVLPFVVHEVMTSDAIAVDVCLDVVLRLEDHNAFFVNVMKDRDKVTTRDLRAMLFPEVKNGVQEAMSRFAHAQLQPSREAKEAIASHLEHHLHTTFSRIGLDFGQVRAIEFDQEVLDKTARKASQRETEARDIEADSQGTFRVERARQRARDMEREIRRGELGEERAERSLDREKRQGELEDREEDLHIDEQGNRLDLKEKDIKGRHRLDSDKLDHEQRLAGQKEDNRFQLSSESEDAEFITRRLAVYEKLKKADVSKIKTDEDFRKFRLEVDRDQALDDAEWQEFKDELLWKGEDRRRDRSFLVRKIELQQGFDLRRLEILNNSELSITVKEQKLRQAQQDWRREKGELAHEIEMAREREKEEQERRRRKAALDAELEKQQAEHEATVNEIRELSAKDLELKKQIKELEMQRAAFKQAIEQEQDKALARHEIELLELEITQKKQEMGLAGLEKIKAIKRRDQQERDLHQLEMEIRRFEMEEKRWQHKLAQDELASRLRREEMQAAGQVETDRLAAMGSLSLEQLIAVSGMDQAKVLGELGQTRAMQGMSAEEIMAMNDPAALGRALEERYKKSGDAELKVLYERLAQQADSAREQAGRIYQEAAERQERMFNQALGSMKDAQGTILAGERRVSEAHQDAADRTERMARHGMEQMGDVASTRARPGEGDAGSSGRAGEAEKTEKLKVRVCTNCKQEVADTENFCPNCGTRMY